MVEKLINKVIESMREDCENISSLYGENSCKYCKHNNLCESISKLNFKRWLYDIYKYCEDEFGNSIILYKNYKYLYDELPKFSSEEEIPTTAEDRALSGIGDVAYVHNPDMGIYYNKYVFNVKSAGGAREWTLVGKFEPSYNDKKNTPGELWIRFKNHPIAFPAFDLIEREEESS